jgi:hypothetical protein
MKPFSQHAAFALDGRTQLTAVPPLWILIHHPVAGVSHHFIIIITINHGFHWIWRGRCI